MTNDLSAKTALNWTSERKRKSGRAKTTRRTTEEELKAAGLTWRQRHGEPKAEGTEGCWADVETAAWRAQGRGN